MPIRCVHCRLPSLNICFLRLDPPGPLEYLPEQIQHAIYGYTNIGCDEVVVIEFLCLARECVETIKKENDGEKTEREPGGVRLEARFEDERVTANALCAQRAMESDVCNRDGHPGHDCGDCCKILEPLEDGLGASRARHVGQQGHGGSNTNAIVRNSSVFTNVSEASDHLRSEKL